MPNDFFCCCYQVLHCLYFHIATICLFSECLSSLRKTKTLVKILLLTQIHYWLKRRSFEFMHQCLVLFLVIFVFQEFRSCSSFFWNCKIQCFSGEESYYCKKLFCWLRHMRIASIACKFIWWIHCNKIPRKREDSKWR